MNNKLSISKIYNSKNNILLLFSIYLAAFVIRFVKLCEMSIIDRDSTRYLQLASDWFNFGAKYAYSHQALMDIPPLYCFILSLGGYVGLKPEYFGYIISIILGALIPIAVFYITYAIFMRKDFSFIAALLATVQPYLILSSVRILRDAVYLPLLIFGIAFALYAINKKSLMMWFFFTLCIVGASASRVEGIVMIPIFIIWVFYELLFEKGSLISRIKYLTQVVFIVIVVYFGLIYSIRYSLSETKATWSNTELLSLKYLGRGYIE